MDTNDIVKAAEQIIASSPSNEDGTYILWTDGYRVTRAISGREFARRPDLRLWAARITGRDAKFGFKREFLGKAWPLRYDRRAIAAIDFSDVHAGDILEIAGAGSWKHSDERTMYKVVSIDDRGIRLVNAETSDLPR